MKTIRPTFLSLIAAVITLHVWATNASAQLAPPAAPDQAQAIATIKEAWGEFGLDPQDPGRIVAVAFDERRLSPAVIHAISTLTQLRSLGVRRAREVDNSVLSTFAGLQELRKIDLSETKVTDAGVRSLAAFPHLEEVNLEGCKITDDSMRDLSVLGALRVLDLSATSVGRHGLKELKNAPALRELRMRCNSGRDDDLRAISELTQLEVLRLQTPSGTARGVTALKTLKSLKELEIYFSHADDSFIVAIAGLTHLRKLTLRGGDLGDAAAAALVHFEQLGLAKKESSAYMKQAGLAPSGGLWATKCECIPITDRAHFDSVERYVANHEKKGGVIWRKPKPPSLDELDLRVFLFDGS